MSGYKKYASWSWVTPRGTIVIITENNVSLEKIKNYIETSVNFGGSGNYDPKSITHKTLRLKIERAEEKIVRL
jgi:hypothetical protein